MAEPDYFQNEMLLEWLGSQPRDVAMAIAVRAALRVVPLTRTGFDHSEHKPAQVRAGLVLPVFRAVAVPWAALVFPVHGKELEIAAAAADDLAIYIAADADAAFRAAADAAFAAADASSTDYNVAYATAAGYATSYAAEAAAAVATDDAAAVAQTLDIILFRDGIGGASDHVQQPIWNKQMPDWMAEHWVALRDKLKGYDDWDVWIRWYEARLSGGLTYPHLSAEANEAIELARVLEITEEDWKAGPAAVNGKIKAIEARYGAQDRNPNPSEIIIPGQMPAAIEPVWVKDRLTIDQNAAKSLLDNAAIEAAFQALSQEFQALLNDLPSEANIDPRAIKYLTEVAEGLPDAVPSQDQQFAIAHRGDALAIYGSTVNQEWPSLLAARYQALVLHYDRVMRQFPQWVEFKRNAAVQVTPVEELDRASELSRNLRDVLSQGVEAGFVDPDLPEAIEKLEDVHSANKENSLPGADANSDNLLSLDILESANNAVKQLAAKVLEKIEQASRYSAGHISKGANDALEKGLQGLGKLLVNTVWFGFATGTATIFGSWLVTNFPQTFNWLRPVLEALKAII